MDSDKLSQGYGSVEDAVGIAAVHAALGAGVSMFDTAMSYGAGDNERLLGRALHAGGADGRRAAIATKVGIVRTPTGVELDADPRRIRDYAVASLQRLGREVIDLYYLHRLDPRFGLDEQLGAMAALKTEGLVRAIGVSEVTAEQLRAAHAATPIAAVQVEWSLAWRTPEIELVPLAGELGIAVVPYSPIGRGLLGGDAAYADPATSVFRASDPRFNDAHLPTNLAVAKRIRALAQQLGVTTGQLALAWLLHQGHNVVPIPGSHRAERIVENAGAADIDLGTSILDDIAAVTHDFVGDRHSFAVPGTARLQ